MVRNRSFEDGNGRRGELTLEYWNPVGNAECFLSDKPGANANDRHCVTVRGRMGAGIANEGYYYPPHLIKAFGDGTPLPEVMTTKMETGIEQRHFKVMKAGLRTVFNGPAGTARRYEMNDIAQCGKTGTAQNPHGNNHSLFIAFAPAEDPKIAIAVIVENSGYGATWAAPIASLMIEKYIRGHVERPELEKRMMEGVVIYKKER